jgi:hypothetical protein
VDRRAVLASSVTKRPARRNYFRDELRLPLLWNLGPWSYSKTKRSPVSCETRSIRCGGRVGLNKSETNDGTLRCLAGYRDWLGEKSRKNIGVNTAAETTVDQFAKKL